MATTTRTDKWNVTVGGRTLPTVGAAASFAQGVLVREDQAREMVVFENGVERLVVKTAGKGVVETWTVA